MRCEMILPRNEIRGEITKYYFTEFCLCTYEYLTISSHTITPIALVLQLWATLLRILFRIDQLFCV